MILLIYFPNLAGLMELCKSPKIIKTFRERERERERKGHKTKKKHEEKEIKG